MRNGVKGNNSIVRRFVGAIMFRFGYVRYSELTAKSENYSKTISSLNNEIKKQNKDLDFFKGEYEAAWSLLKELDLAPTAKETKKTTKKTRKTSKKQTHRGPYDKTNKTRTPRQVGGYTRTYKSGKVVEVGPFVRNCWVTNGKLMG